MNLEANINNINYIRYMQEQEEKKGGYRNDNGEKAKHNLEREQTTKRPKTQ